VSELADTLKAGGMVPANAKLGKADVVDTVVARAYAHAVLPGRTVIRLCAQSVAIGDDLEMATLGFGPGADRGAVAKERKRPLGFPGWALVHDPKNARYALEVVKEFKQQARKAKSKPGHAKDGIDAIAKRLGKSVPHFLPAFFEEAGRVFIEHGAQSYAAAMFGKAREAEAVHALEVDEQHRVDGFLEFALAGAVSTKALTQYAKELAGNHAPDVAYAHFRQLCLQRTLGGMPPWSGMSKELNRLAKAAKLDPAAEDAAFIAEIIESPALAKAAGEFWRAYAEPITALGKQSAAARGALLNLFPTGTTYNPDLDEVWLELLEATGAVQALTSDHAPPEAQPNGGRAAWFDKLTAHLARSWRDTKLSGRAFELLRRMAPMLVADGKPISCVKRYHRMDLDLVELALELGVPVAPVEHAGLDLEGWGKTCAEPDRGRDPVRAAAHPTIGPLLTTAVANEIGDEPWESASRGKLGFLAAKRAWLEAVIAGAEQGGLSALELALSLVNTKVTAETFAELPDLHARFAALDLAPSLARTLAVGLVDEFGWPALEEAALELNPDGKTALAVHGGPPAVVLVTKTRAIALGPTSRLGTHDLVIPPKCEFATIRFIGGEFLVVLKEGYKVRCYWSSAPHDVFEAPDVSTWSLPAVVSDAVVLADGAWLETMTPMRRGDRKLAIGGTIAACDGTTSWASDYQNGEHRWREVTASGELGRTSWPTWIEGAIEPGSSDWRIDQGSYLYPAPAGITRSPLGVADGMVGARIRYQGGTNVHTPMRRELETIDGLKWTSPQYVPATALLRLPDGGAPRPLVETSSYGQPPAVTIYDPTGRFAGSVVGGDRRFSRGQVAALPLGCWHLFTPRDEAGSRRLHAVTDDDARALMAAVPVTAGTPPRVAVPEPVELASGVLPEITHPRLRAGVTGLAIMAVQHRLERDRLVAERAPGAAVKPAAQGPDDAALIAALGPWTERQWSPQGRAWTQIERAGELFASEDRSDRVVTTAPASIFEWLGFAAAPWSLAFLATSIGTPADQRRIVAELLAMIVRSLPRADQLRVVQVTREPAARSADDKLAPCELRWHAGNAYALRRLGWSGNAFAVLEYAPDGTFKPLPGCVLGAEQRGTTGPSPDEVAAVAAAVATGKTSWSGALADQLATETGLSPSEAAFLLAGCPNANDRGANFLDKTLRETLGLKATQAAIARDGLAAVPLAKRLAAIDEAGRAGVAALLDGSAVPVLAAAWKRIVGVRVAIPEELVADATDLRAPIQPSLALAMIAGAADSPQLAVDGSWALDGRGNVIRVSKPEPVVGQTKLEDDSPVFDAQVLQTLVVHVPFLYAALPVGHVLRTQAARAYELGLARLRNPALWLEAGACALGSEPDVRAATDRMLEGLGGEVLTGFDDGWTGRRLPGAIVTRTNYQFELRVHPATLDARALAVVDKLAAQVQQWGVSNYQALAYLRSNDLVAIVARLAKTPVPEGGWEQNPVASAPKLVDKVAAQRELSRDAAALYLQYLVLLWPTAKNLLEWNGWRPKQLEAAIAELVDHELVLEAKRERAGRAYFLPGGWDALKSPHPPMESWKLAFYGTRGPDGSPKPAFQRFQALAPFHQLFERAWQRIEAGDVPRYEEVKR
jgi:hypothetical protein